MVVFLLAHILMDGMQERTRSSRRCRSVIFSFYLLGFVNFYVIIFHNVLYAK
jgi:hypothetical protein